MNAAISATWLVPKAGFGHQMSLAFATGLTRVAETRRMMMCSMFRNKLANDMAHRFLAPKSPRQQRYEAFRARFVEGCPTQEAARRIGYSHGSFRNLCPRFVNVGDPDLLFPVPGGAKTLEARRLDGCAECR